jgi:hypothetical protein
MSRILRVAAAFVLSLGAYLTPIITPHATFFLGELVWSALVNEHDAALGAASVAAALLAQLFAFLLFLWFLSRPGWLRAVGATVSILPAIVGLTYVYLVALPTYFLVATDTAAEVGSWPIECTARGIWIPAIAAPPSASRGAPIWVKEVDPPGRYALLDPNGCTVTPLRGVLPATGEVVYLASGRALYVGTTPGSDRQAWVVVDVASGETYPLEGRQGEPMILSTDGRSAAWLRPVAGPMPPIEFEAVIHSIDGSGERIVPLSALEPGGQQLVQVDTVADELIVARRLSELFWLGMDGRPRRHLKPDGVEPQPHTFQLPQDGWVAWDAYRDDAPYRVAWTLSGGSGRYRLPKHRSVTSLALSPDGQWIALSITSTLSLGSTPDVVAVLRVADGSEAFRRYLPKYTRASVAFPDARRFVYTDLEGVRVLKIPDGEGRS